MYKVFLNLDYFFPLTRSTRLELQDHLKDEIHNIQENNKENKVRWRHHYLNNGWGSILTVCTVLDHKTRNVKIGYSVFNGKDKYWIRRYGLVSSYKRLVDDGLNFNLSESEPVLCDYISLRSLLLFLAVSNVEYSVSPSTNYFVTQEIESLSNSLREKTEFNFN